jgi:hypothetical protein
VIAVLALAAPASAAPRVTPKADTGAGRGFIYLMPECHFTLDRADTQRLAARLRKWDKSGDAASDFASSLVCLRLGNGYAAVLCGAIVLGGRALLYDLVQQADADGSCVSFSYSLAGPILYPLANSDPACTGERTR